MVRTSIHAGQSAEGIDEDKGAPRPVGLVCHGGEKEPSDMGPP